MTSQEWEAKYNEMVNIAKDLTQCPYRGDDKVACATCNLINKCYVTASVLALNPIV